MKHQSYVPPGEPLVAKNPFRGQKNKSQPIPPFADARHRLPEPVLPDHSHWLEMYWRAWEVAWSNLRQPRSGGRLVANHIQPSHSGHLSLWETVFTTQFTLYGRRAFPFITTLDNFYALQEEDGLIHGRLDLETGQPFLPPHNPNGAAPQIMAWAEWRYFRISGNEERLAKVFWPLLAYHRWQQANRTWPNGLYWTTGYSAGLFDPQRIPDGLYNHQHWNWLDANLQALVNCHLLDRMALQLGENETAAELTSEQVRLQELLSDNFWNEETDFYHDVDRDGQFSPAKSLVAYWALLDKELTLDDRLASFLRHLREDRVFRRQHPAPSLSADSAGYDSQQTGVWSPLNFMLLKGLRGVEQFSLAHKLALRHLEQVSQVYQHTDTFWDYYLAEAAVPGPEARPDAIGCTGLTPIAILIEDVIGLQVDWPLRRVSWDRRLPGDNLYGICDLPIGPDGKVDLLGDREKIMITTNIPFTLVVRDEEMNLQVALPAGETTLEL